MRLFRCLGLCAVLLAAASAAQARTFTVMAYNVENLFDADGQAVFDDYRPSHYSRAHVLTKLQNIARVVGQYEGGRGPDVILLAEIEVDQTPGPVPPDYAALLRRYAGVSLEEMLGAKFDAAVADLPAEALLAKAFADRGMTGYQIIAGDTGPAARPQPPHAQKCVIFTRLPVQAVRVLPTPGARAILEVQLDADGAPLHVFANHWKSGAGDAGTEKIRIENARTLRGRIDEILQADPSADLIIGGDFNSQYNQSARYAATMPQTGLNDILRSQGDAVAVRGPQRDLYNLWYEVPAAERGSDTFRGEWGTLIQLILSRGLLDYRGVQYVAHSFAVGKFSGLNEDAAGRPRRWSFAGLGGAGCSDHFPLTARFTTVADGNPDRYLPVARPAPEPTVAPAPARPDPRAIDLARVGLTAAQLPAGAGLRTPAYAGKIIRVEGRVGAGARLTVEFLGETYDVWSFDAPLRARLRAAYPAGAPLRFYGELGQYKGHWQFVIRDESWVQ